MVMQVGVIEKFAEDSELQDEIRLLGGIPLILALLRSATQYVAICTHIQTQTCTHKQLP